MSRIPRSHSLLIIIACAAVAIWAIMLMDGCSPKIATPTPKPVCRHYALIAAAVYGEKYPVRIGIGKSYTAGKYHAQAEAQINGEWLPLETGKILITVGSQDAFTPDYYMQLDSYGQYLSRVRP